MFTSKTKHYWRDKPLDDCSKEELIDCINHIYEYYVNSKGKNYPNIPNNPISPNYLRPEPYINPMEVWCKT